MQKKVSIITLTYNSGNELYESIRSVLDQDYAGIELIVSDDCSAEFDEDRIKDFAAKWNKNGIDVTVIRNPVNMGTVRNINNAVKRSCGDIVINLSAGDVFRNNHIVSEIIREFDSRKCGALVTRRLMYDGDISNVTGYIPSDFEISKIRRVSSTLDEFTALFTDNSHNKASGSVFACTRELLTENGYYDEKYRLWEDGPFFASLYKKGQKIDYNYDIVSIFYKCGGVSTGRIPDALRNDIRIFYEYGLSQKDLIKGYNRRLLQYNYVRKTVAYDNKLLLVIYRCLFIDVMVYRLAQRIEERVYNRSHGV